MSASVHFTVAQICTHKNTHTCTGSHVPTHAYTQSHAHTVVMNCNGYGSPWILHTFTLECSVSFQLKCCCSTSTIHSCSSFQLHTVFTCRQKFNHSSYFQHPFPFFTLISASGKGCTSFPKVPINKKYCNTCIGILCVCRDFVVQQLLRSHQQQCPCIDFDMSSRRQPKDQVQEGVILENLGRRRRAPVAECLMSWEGSLPGGAR